MQGQLLGIMQIGDAAARLALSGLLLLLLLGSTLQQKVRHLIELIGRFRIYIPYNLLRDRSYATEIGRRMTGTMSCPSNATYLN